MNSPIPRGSVMDDRLISREFYNANGFPITFTLQKKYLLYLITAGKIQNPLKIVCDPEKWVHLPHALYTASWPEGRLADEVIAHFNFGNDMFKGKRPNRDTLRKANLHTKG